MQDEIFVSVQALDLSGVIPIKLLELAWYKQSADQL